MRLPCGLGQGATNGSARAAGRRQRGRARRRPVADTGVVAALVVAPDAEDPAVGRVDLDVLAADVDVEHEAAVVLLEVDLVEAARRRGLRGADRLRLGDPRLRQQVLPVVEA